MSLMLLEAIHSTALSCGCGTCLACRASAGDKQALARLYAAVVSAVIDSQHVAATAHRDGATKP